MWNSFAFFSFDELDEMSLKSKEFSLTYQRHNQQGCFVILWTIDDVKELIVDRRNVGGISVPKTKRKKRQKFPSEKKEKTYAEFDQNFRRDLLKK